MDAEASRKQLENIRSFILLEAREKADEIRMKAKGDADKERQEQVLSAKNKIAEEYERKEKQQALDQRIKASMEERRQRARLLEKRDIYVAELGKEAKAKLTAVASSNAKAYANLVKGLIKQSMSVLTGENKVDIRCRPQDVEVVRQLAPIAAAELTAELRAQGEERPIAATVSADATLAGSAGGVVVTAMDGRIKCNNLLEERLKLALADLQPYIRYELFPSARAELRTKPAVQIHGHSAAVGTSIPGQAAAFAAAASRASAAAALAARTPAVPVATVPAATSSTAAPPTSARAPAPAPHPHASFAGVAATALAGAHHPGAHPSAGAVGGAGGSFGAAPAGFDAWGTAGGHSAAPQAGTAAAGHFGGGFDNWGAAPAGTAGATTTTAGWGTAPAQQGTTGGAAGAFSF